MNTGRLRSPLSMRLPTWPRLLTDTAFPKHWAIHWLQPLEDVTNVPTASVDAVVADHVLCIADHLPELLAEMARICRPHGRLIIADVVRKRNLPSDLEQQPTLWACGLTQTPLRDQLAGLLAAAGFTIQHINETPDQLAAILAEFDRQLPAEPQATLPISEAEWIASTQACCGIQGPRTEQLSEVLKCDDIHAIWSVIHIMASRTGD